jgi:thiaminase
MFSLHSVHTVFYSLNKLTLKISLIHRYVLDIGLSEDWVALQMSMAPCLLGYGAIARRLYDDPRTKTKSEGNIYWNWIENYVADDYVQAVKAGSGE